MGSTLSQANTAASNAGLNISISGAALTGTNAVSDTQSIAEGEKVPAWNSCSGEFCGVGYSTLARCP